VSQLKPLIVLGAGGHAKVLIAALLAGPAKILGIAERAGSDKMSDVLGVPVLGDDSSVLQHAPQDILLVNGVGSTSFTERRQKLFEKFAALGYHFATVLHPTATIASDVRLGEGVQVMAGAIIQPGTTVGDNCILNTKTSIDHDCQIAAHVHIAPGSTISGDTRIGEGTFIGAGAVVIQGIEIGRRCMVAAGAVVIHDLKADARVAGVPAQGMKVKDQEK
jgi:sugar O-acyltransferase (sialic acid O-acetyltransferase NeuD family)